MRLILDDVSHAKLTTVLDALRKEFIDVEAGGTFGSEGIILVKHEKDGAPALEVLNRMGIMARIG